MIFRMAKKAAHALYIVKWGWESLQKNCPPGGDEEFDSFSRVFAVPNDNS